METKQYKYLPFLMWLLPLLFFTYQFILRLWPGLMMSQIKEQFSIDASQFGLLAAFYYYGYAVMQIPVAMLLDRFKAKNIIFIFALICGVANLVFIHTNSFNIAIFSRLLIGVGSAVGILGVSKIVSEWFSKDQYTKMIGFSFTIGLMGAIYSGKPLSLLIETYNSKNIAIILSLISIAIGCLNYLCLREPTNITTNLKQEEKFELSNLTIILSSKNIWLLGIANLLLVGFLEGFADVWGVQYLMIAYDLNKADAAGLISFIFFGMLFGGPILAYLSKKIGNYLVIIACGLLMAFIFLMLLLNGSYNWWLFSSCFFIIGVLCCYQIIVFAVGSDLVASQYLGVTIAFLNSINMLGGSFYHTLIGRVMDIFWSGALNNEGLREYNLLTYKYSLSLIPLCSVIGSLVIYFLYINMKRNKINV